MKIYEPGTPINIKDLGNGGSLVARGIVEEIVIKRNGVVEYRVSYWNGLNLQNIVVNEHEASAEEPELITIGFK